MIGGWVAASVASFLMCVPTALALAEESSRTRAADASEASMGAGTGAGAGASIVVEPQPHPWGASTDTVLIFGPHQVLPWNDGVTWGTVMFPGFGVGVYQTSINALDWLYQLHLPGGAVLQRMELEACDNSTTAGIRFVFARGATPAGSITNISAIATTGTTPTPGCAFYSVAPTSSTTIDNAANNYWIAFSWEGFGFGNTIRVHSFRIYYRLQVSPAPAVATFPNDVPTTHPFFRFIEAMAASGITGGCGPGSFCPDNPVTRGQMAVFLATALGLHFAP